MKKLFIKFSMMLFVLGMSTNTVWAFDQLMEQLNNEVYFAEMTATPSQTGSGKVYITGKTETFSADFDWDACAESSTVSRGIGAVVEGMDMVQVPFIMYCKANDGWYFKGWSYTQGGTDLEPLARDPGDEAVYDSHIGVLVNPSKQNGAENAKSYTIYATFDKIYVSNYSISGTNTVAKNGNITQTITFNLVGNDLDENDFNAPSIVSTTGVGTWSSADGDDLVLSDVTINNSSKTATIDVKYIAPDEEDAQSTATLRFESKSGSRLDVVLSARTTSSSDVEAFLYNGNTKIGEGGTINDILNSDISAYKNPILRLNKAHNGTIDIAKKITLDLNGYTLGGLTISTGADAVLAYSSFGGKISGNVNVNGGKLTLNGGSIEGAISISGGAELVQNGAAVTTVNNAGSLTTLDGTFSGTVTSGGTLLVKGGSFTGAPAIVTSGNATIQKGTIKSATYGVESSGTTTIEKVVAIKGTTKALNITAGTTTLKCGRFESPDALVTGSGTLAFESAYFKSNSGLETYQGKQVWRVTVGTEYREGYNYFAGDREQALTAGLSVCRIGNTSYSSLEDALAYANNNTDEDVVIVMENDYILPAGYYTLPSNATLLVPMKENQDAGSEVVKRNIAGENDYIKPSKYRKLTLANGVNIDVHGTIEVSGSQLSTNETYTGAPFGPYGQIHMNGGSKMVLQNGSELRAWGFVTFDGNAEIDARRGSMVRELFQLGDWKDFYFSGKGLLANLGSSLGEEIFPITQYYIQNIEAPVKYHPGAKLSTATGVYAYFPKGMLGTDRPPMDMNVIMTANNIPIVGVTGDDAMFLMDANADAENTWVRKWYDTSKDQQVYEINSGAHIGKLVIPLVYAFGGENALLDMNSGAYNLPITNNFKLHLLSGEMAFTQATALLPGAEVEVDKEAIVYVYAGSTGVRGGQLYVYDAENWGEYAMNAKARQVKYSPSFDGAPNLRDTVNLVDASINVRGTFDTQGGFVYTTEGGANIFSSVEDAGTFIFTEVPTEEQKTATIDQVSNVVRESGEATRNTATCNLAYLRNSDAWVDNGGSSYVETEDAAAGTSFCYLDIDGQGGRWTNLQQRGCFTYDGTPGYEAYYIKPQEYVAVSVSNEEQDGDDWIIEGNADHTFSDAAGAGRLFINLGNPYSPSECQWWEVEKKDNYYHCIHPDNDTYYEWDKGEEEWKEVKFTITWKNWDGSPITDAEDNPVVYEVPYGTQAEWLSSNPTRPANLDYTYTFTGWSPALGKVTSDVTYTATYEPKQIKYTITFVQDGGVEIERHLLARDEVPVCENAPTRTGYILQWDPAIEPVVGNKTYTATWLPEPPETYTITFKNYDGTVLKKKSDGSANAVFAVEAGTTPSDVDVATPTKDETTEYTYSFTGWKPALAPATTNATYVAQFNEVAKTYTIKFVKENGDPDVPEDVIESHQYQYGETPICANTPTKDADAQYTYALRWEPQIQTVMEDATYTAVFDETLNKYTVSVMSNPSGACSISGAGIYDYNTSATAVTITITQNPGYTFAGWSDGQGGTNTTRQMAVTGDINLVANFTVSEPDYTITWKNEAGTANLIAPVGQKANTATIYTGATPTKPASVQYTYTFDGWTTSPNGAGTFYKNNMTPKATTNATYYAHFAATEVIMEVGLGQAQNIAEATTVNQLILNSNGTVSGQLTGDINTLLTVTGACYYDLTGTFNAGKWYAVAVPWQVTAGDIKANGASLSWNSGNYLAYYDGSVRAAQGKVDACWKYLSNGNVLEPGRLYMLYLENNASVLRFPKKASAPILNASTSVSAYDSGVAADANWNGIANPAIFYAYLSNTGATVGQVFNADAQSYEAVALSNKLIVAKPIFVQAANNGTASAVTTPPAPAPVRRNVVDETLKAEFQVEIASYGRMQDRLFIRTNDNKEADTYTLGQDVLKFGISNSVAQMWVNRYDAKLCMNTVVPFNNVAEFPLSIFAPRAGEYTISKVKSKISKECDLYLTRNGEAIWNLSESDYVMTLEQGTTDEYGLRVSAKAPQVATGMDEAVVDAQGETQKVLIDNKVFIIRGNNVYSIDGQLVK